MAEQEEEEVGDGFWEEEGEEEEVYSPEDLKPVAPDTGGDESLRATTAEPGDQDESAKVEGSNTAHLFVFTNDKAGMGKVDKSKVNKVVYEMSKDSAYFAHASSQDKKNDKRIHDLREKLQSLSLSRRSSLASEVSALEIKLEKQRFCRRVCVVVDMDCYYAAVEMRDNPHLRDKPMAVGGIGMISTANYKAREYGVRSAMPGFIALKLCPELIFVRSHFDKYKETSDRVLTVLRQYDPHCRMMSLDEAYLDLTEEVSRRQVEETSSKANLEGGAQMELEEMASRVVAELRAKVQEASGGLTCSAGLAPNFRLAKIASDVKKPNGQCIVPFHREAAIAFLHSMPVRKVGGIGKVMEKTLKEVFGVETVAELFEKRLELFHCLTPKSSHWLLRVALAIHHDDEAKAMAEWKTAVGDGEDAAEATSVQSVRRKGISCERTFAPLSNRADLQAKLSSLCRTLAEHMSAKALSGRTVTLKLKTTKFEVRSRAATAPAGTYVSTGEDIERLVMPLLEKEFPLSLRLMGIRVSHFKNQFKALDAGQRTIGSFMQRGAAGAKPFPSLSHGAHPKAASTAATASSPIKAPSQLISFPASPHRIYDAFSSSQHKARTALGTVDPSLVDPAVLRELPPDVRHEIEHALLQERNARLQHRPAPRDPPAAPITELLERSANGRKRRLLCPSEVSEDVLEELPEEVAREIREQLDESRRRLDGRDVPPSKLPVKTNKNKKKKKGEDDREKKKPNKSIQELLLMRQ